jgi:hypothetical protein
VLFLCFPRDSLMLFLCCLQLANRIHKLLTYVVYCHTVAFTRHSLGLSGMSISISLGGSATPRPLHRYRGTSCSCLCFALCCILCIPYVILMLSLCYPYVYLMLSLCSPYRVTVRGIKCLFNVNSIVVSVGLKCRRYSTFCMRKPSENYPTY